MIKLDNVKQMVNTFGDSVKNHADTILLLSGIGLTFVAGVLSDRAYMNTKKCIDEAGGDNIPTKEKLKIAARESIPAVSAGCAAVVCLTQSNKIGKRKYSSLAAAYAISESKYKEYRKQVSEVIGNDEEKTIHDNATRKSHDTNRVVFSGNGDVRCIELISNQIFESNWNTIKDVQTSMNYRLCSGESFISVNEIFEELGLDPIKLGTDYGWVSTKGPYEISIDTTDIDGIPYLTIDFDTHHRYS